MNTFEKILNFYHDALCFCGWHVGNWREYGCPDCRRKTQWWEFWK
jgi:hypothetical protein